MGLVEGVLGNSPRHCWDEATYSSSISLDNRTSPEECFAHLVSYKCCMKNWTARSLELFLKNRLKVADAYCYPFDCGPGYHGSVLLASSLSQFLLILSSSMHLVEVCEEKFDLILLDDFQIRTRARLRGSRFFQKTSRSQCIIQQHNSTCDPTCSICQLMPIAKKLQ